MDDVRSHAVELLRPVWGTLLTATSPVLGHALRTICGVVGEHGHHSDSAVRL